MRYLGYGISTHMRRRRVNIRTLCTIMTARPHYQVLYQDADIVAIAKPYGALSTPGREFRVKAVPRSEEWANSIIELCLRKRVDAAVSETYSNAVEILRRQARVVPRQKEKFLSLLERTARLKDDIVKERIWNDVVHLDKELHALDPDSLPDHLFSAADFASQITGKTVYHVHRLDQETSGVLLFAKSSVAASMLSKQFREREIDKTYIALLDGILPDDVQSLVDVPISAIETCKPKQQVDWINGKPSQTTLELIAPDNELFQRRLSYFPAIDNAPFTMVKLMPLTGRTHQLRVHMKHLGFPIIGDTLYSENPEICPRLCLHAESIKFLHPSTGELIELIDDLSPKAC